MDSEQVRDDPNAGPFTSSIKGGTGRKTLVDYCTNDWQTDPKYAETKRPIAAHDDEDVWYDKYLDALDDFYDNCLAVIKAPKFRRLVLSITTSFLFAWLLWTNILWPWIEEERAAWDTFNTFNTNTSQALFGTNARPHLGGLIQTKDLDASLLPGSQKAGKSRRLIFIGDIHGCKNELLQLLEKVKFDEATDHIVSVGDIVTKGPDSLGVVDFLREKKASVVRGNHDDRVILMAERHRRHAREEGFQNLATRSKSKHDVHSPEGIARALTNEQLKWLQSFPLVLNIGHVKGVGDIVVVHGGLVPGLPLEAQDPVSIMNMRSIDLKTHVPSKLHHHNNKGSKPWFKIWGKYQRLLPAMTKWTGAKKPKLGPETKQMTVIYGHDARMGLQISRFSKGLDSNCARAGQLTALVLDEQGHQQVVQIQCSKDYSSLSDND